MHALVFMHTRAKALYMRIDMGTRLALGTSPTSHSRHFRTVYLLFGTG